MNEFTDDIFDSKQVEKALKKGKRKSIFMIILTSILLFVVSNIINFAVYTYFSNQAFKAWDAHVQLTTPNGYISETTDSKGLFGGETHYKIAKDMKIKSLVVEQGRYSFGLIPSLTISRGAGGKIGVSGSEWQVNYKENGWRDLLFFHPNLEYEKYKNDAELVENFEGDNIYELALSFDKAYSYDELPLKGVSEVDWLWIDTYSEEEMKEMEENSKTHDWSANFIPEGDALGVSVRDLSYAGVFEESYQEFLTRLKISYPKTYQQLKSKPSDEIEILGIVVYGTKEELLPIMNKPYVKAISLGGVTANY